MAKGLLDSLKETWALGAYSVPSLIPMPIPKAAVPANARLLAKSIFNPEPITSEQFSPKEIELLKQTYANSVQRSSKPEAAMYKKYYKDMTKLEDTQPVSGMLAHRKTAPAGLEAELALRKFSPTIQYPDYPRLPAYENYGVGNMPVEASFTDKGYALSTALGRAKYVKDAQGNVHIVDQYDFPKGAGMEDYKNWSKPFAAAHYLGEKFSRTMPVDINLGLLN